jgi:uncharacterized protein YgiM (DUF1202 family)
MLPAPIASKKSLILAISLTAAALVLPRSAWAAAGAPQTCTVGTTCTVGEFLYDDNYDPITAGATCTLTAKEPDGDPYLSQGLTPTTDGWYAHSFTAPSTTGYYRADICCTVDGDDLCLDKSFEVKESSSAPSTGDIATAVWGYSNKTLSGFGDLVSDIWGSSSRTLTSFGTLIQNIWNHNPRTVTNSTGTTVDVSAIKKTVDENRLLLEQLVKKPIIQNFIEEEPTPNLSEKINSTKTITSQLYANNQYIASKSRLIASRWYGLSDKQLLDSVMELSNLLGAETDSSGTNSVFGQVNWLRSSWDWDVADDIFSQTKGVTASLDSVQRQLASSGKNSFSYSQMRSVSSKVDTLLKLVGETTDSAYQRTLFGRLREVQDLALALDSRNADADKILTGWEKNKTSKSLPGIIDDLIKRVLALNKVPKASTVFAGIDKSKPQEIVLKNRVLATKAVVEANKRLLALGTGKTLINFWLEEGSIVFKSLVTNPSKLISQEVPLKYYLPPEVTKESIISSSDGLSINYDAEKNQYYAEGTYKLVAGESITVSVTVDDVWITTDEELDSLKKQAADLSKPLERTSYFAQGVTLTSDINASLDKIKGLRDSAVTPEQKIRAYREGQIEMTAVNEKMTKLKDLVTQAGSTGTLFGFVGGAQTLAVWGLIIIMGAGFVFLALYMRALGVNKAIKEKKAKGKSKGKGKAGEDGEMFETPKGKNGKIGKLIQFALPLIIVAAVSATVSALVVRKVILSSVKEQELAANTQVLGEALEPTPDEETEPPEDLAIGGEEIIKINVPEGSAVNIRSGPSLTADILMRLTTSQEVTKIGEEGEWVNTVLDDIEALELTTEGWVNAKFVTQAQPSTLNETSSYDGEQTIIIGDTPTGWLRVRSAPNGTEIAKVYPGEKYQVVGEASDWWQITLSDGGKGWVSKLYAKKTEY